MKNTHLLLVAISVLCVSCHALRIEKRHNSTGLHIERVASNRSGAISGEKSNQDSVANYSATERTSNGMSPDFEQTERRTTDSAKNSTASYVNENKIATDSINDESGFVNWKRNELGKHLKQKSINEQLKHNIAGKNFWENRLFKTAFIAFLAFGLVASVCIIIGVSNTVLLMLMAMFVTLGLIALLVYFFRAYFPNKPKKRITKEDIFRPRVWKIALLLFLFFGIIAFVTISVGVDSIAAAFYVAIAIICFIVALITFLLKKPVKAESTDPTAPERIYQGSTKQPSGDKASKWAQNFLIGIALVFGSLAIVVLLLT